jgi:hypothetical protein
LKTGLATSALLGISAARSVGSSASTAIFAIPEQLAYGLDGLPKRTLYLVGFDYDELWGTPAGPKDKVLVDIYEHWLDSVG